MGGEHDGLAAARQSLADRRIHQWVKIFTIDT